MDPDMNRIVDRNIHILPEDMGFSSMITCEF
jgi:hypothetical protein